MPLFSGTRDTSLGVVATTVVIASSATLVLLILTLRLVILAKSICKAKRLKGRKVQGVFNSLDDNIAYNPTSRSGQHNTEQVVYDTIPQLADTDAGFFELKTTRPPVPPLPTTQATTETNMKTTDDEDFYDYIPDNSTPKPAAERKISLEVPANSSGAAELPDEYDNIKLATDRKISLEVSTNTLGAAELLDGYDSIKPATDGKISIETNMSYGTAEQPDGNRNAKPATDHNASLEMSTNISYGTAGQPDGNLCEQGENAIYELVQDDEETNTQPPSLSQATATLVVVSTEEKVLDGETGYTNALMIVKNPATHGDKDEDNVYESMDGSI